MLQLKHSGKLNKTDDHIGAVRASFKEFCENSTIHGVRYLAERKRHWTERIWWIFAFGMSVWLCGTSIGNIWVHWRGNPVTISFTEKPLPISAIPFPAITLCPETKTFDNISAEAATFGVGPLKRVPLKEHFRTWMRMRVLEHLCSSTITPQRHDDHPRPEHNRHTNFGFTNETIYDVIQEMSPNVSFIMHQDCVWQNVREPCVEAFVPVFTEEGLCYTFNSLNSQEMYTDEMAPELMIIRDTPNASLWTLEEGYKDPEQNESYPRRICDAKPSSALVFILCLNDRIKEYVCDDRIPGFRFYLHMPGEVPAMTRKYFQVSRLEATGVLIKPQYMSTSEGLRSFHPNQRQCYFTSERHLRFFKIYSHNNCELECLSNFTQLECGCVKFSMPRDRHTKICGAPKIRCYRNAEQKLFAEHSRNNTPKLFRERCNCLQSCISITYDADLDRVNLNTANPNDEPDMPPLPPNSNRPNRPPKPNESNRPCDPFKFSLRSSHVRIFFNHHEVDTLRRSETYTLSNFMAICGGLLGLFLGMSALSIIEFIYFSTLRLYWSIHEWKPKNIVVPFKRRVKHISFDIPNI